MIVLPIKEFMAAQGFTQVIPIVRKNANTYGFLTFMDSKNKSTNVYLSKSMNETEAGNCTLEFLRSLKACESTNTEGELRWKLTDSAGMRVDLDSL